MPIGRHDISLCWVAESAGKKLFSDQTPANEVQDVPNGLVVTLIAGAGWAKAVYDEGVS